MCSGGGIHSSDPPDNFGDAVFDRALLLYIFLHKLISKPGTCLSVISGASAEHNYV